LDSIRYFVALLVLVALPPGILLWFFIHPFARFWRKLGPVWTYVVLSPPTGALMLAVFLLRKQLLSVDFGTNIPLIVLGVTCLCLAIIIQRQRRRHLTNAILTGIPELSRDKEPGELLTGGIYGLIRHPRYIEILLFTLAYSLFANFLAPYLATLLSVPALYLVVILEERELRQRFGKKYEEYCATVPRFVPRIFSLG
jgi:protein-S-isoprenylcysteine O-methyltransferase Ste14